MTQEDTVAGAHNGKSTALHQGKARRKDISKLDSLPFPAQTQEWKLRTLCVCALGQRELWEAFPFCCDSKSALKNNNFGKKKKKLWEEKVWERNRHAPD